jgi:hypothetical protein
MTRRLFLLAAVAAALAAQDFTGKVVSITDGDTIRVMHDSVSERIRFWGIDCPESKEAFGTRAKQFTGDLAFGQTVTVKVRDVDRYKRTVAVIILFADGGVRRRDHHEGARVGDHPAHVPESDPLGEGPQEVGDLREAILSPEDTARVLASLEEPNLLICETCLDTGTRISEVTGLMVKHVDLDKGIIRIEQRHCRGDIDVPKTAKSKRTLTMGGLTARYKAWIAGLKRKGPNDWVFPQD